MSLYTGGVRPSVGPPELRGGLWLGLVLAVLAATQLAGVRPASAHASFVAASPRPGLGVPQAPGAVVLRFTEPLNRRLSRIEVLDGKGNDVGEGPTAAVEGDGLAMQRRLGLLPPGTYTVRWTTVSTLDGHRLQGSYSFGVGTAATDAETVRASAVDSEGWLGLLGRLAALLGLSLWIGAGLLGRVAAGAGLGPARLLRLGRLAPGLVLGGTAASLLSLATLSTGSATRVLEVLSAGQSGWFRAGLLVLSAAGLAVGARWAGLGLALAAAAVVTEAASGHAASSPAPALATASFSVHLTAVGAWVFAIAAAALARPVRPVLAALTPYAVGAAAVVALTGALNAALELNRPGELVSTGYGRVVLLKVAVITTMAGLGLSHYRLRRQPAAGEGLVRRPVRRELGAAMAGLVAATVLVGTPNPPREAEAAERVAAGDVVLAGLGSRPALSLAGASGPVVVGLTVLPPEPGPVELRVYVDGAEAGDGLRRVRVLGRGPAGARLEVPLALCGFGCFAGRAVLARGEWELGAQAESNRGPLRASFSTPIPAPDGRAELARAIQAMERLRSAAMREDLRGAVDGPLIVADYRFFAPDAFEIRVAGREQVVIGDRSYERLDPAGTWTEGPWPGLPYTWPKGYYRTFWGDAAAVRLVGTEVVEGVPSRVVAFVLPRLPAWFRLWVGVNDGLVRRQEMRTRGHLMDHTYRDLDATSPIRPPI